MGSEISRAKRGFTLVELMIVVTIVSVLAALAGVAFTRVTRNQRYNEAVNFIATVHAGQAMYRSSYGNYCSMIDVSATTPTDAHYDPATATVLSAGGGVVQWTTPNLTWAQCLIETPGQTRFQYMLVGASAGTACPNPPVDGDGVPAAAQSPCTGINTAASDWYWVTMRGDLDGDTTMSYSHSHSEMIDATPYRISHNE